jgi:hypothetical protein
MIIINNNKMYPHPRNCYFVFSVFELIVGTYNFY